MWEGVTATGCLGKASHSWGLRRIVNKMERREMPAFALMGVFELEI